jgi:hypothetical protein
MVSILTQMPIQVHTAILTRGQMVSFEHDPSSTHLLSRLAASLQSWQQAVGSLQQAALNPGSIAER